MSSEALPATWDELRLDPRILEAIRSLCWRTPTAVQCACIREAMLGHDVAVQARTGTGKTGAFLCPIIQRILSEREVAKKTKVPMRLPCALIVVPSVELGRQTVEAATALCKHINPRITIEDLCNNNSSSNSSSKNNTNMSGLTDSAASSADIVVAPAAVIARAMKNGQLTDATLSKLRVLVLDEADWLADVASSAMQTIQSTLAPYSLQVLMLSATLTEGVASLKGHLQHNPTSIVLTGSEGNAAPGSSTTSSSKKRGREEEEPIIESRIAVRDTEKKSLHQYYLVAGEECHEHSLLFALYRLNLISGKTLLFVDTEEETYQLQAFLEQLSVAAAVYDTHLPMNIRLDTLRKFQSGEVATLLCTDSTLERAGEDAAQFDAAADEEVPKKKKSRHERRSAGDNSEASALHRGIDFADVRNVIIFNGIDHPSALAFNKYTHRVGRTGRAGQDGTSILILRVPQAQRVLGPLREYLRGRQEKLRPFKKMQRTEAAKLQYRVDTVLENVTRTATRRLRVATVASELARSNYLLSHMTEKDTDVLRRIVNHSKGHVKSDKALLEVPKYMRLKKVDGVDDYVERVNASHKGRLEDKFRQATRRQQQDPLKNVVTKVKHDVATAKRKEKTAKKAAKKQALPDAAEEEAE